MKVILSEKKTAVPALDLSLEKALGTSDQNGGEFAASLIILALWECLTFSSLLLTIALGPELLYKGKNLPPRTSECRFLSEFLSALSIIWSSLVGV